MKIKNNHTNWGCIRPNSLNTISAFRRFTRLANNTPPEYYSFLALGGDQYKKSELSKSTCGPVTVEVIEDDRWSSSVILVMTGHYNVEIIFWKETYCSDSWTRDTKKRQSIVFVNVNKTKGLLFLPPKQNTRNDCQERIWKLLLLIICDYTRDDKWRTVIYRRY